MTAVLRCPECGHRHPLDDVTSKDTFRCEGCSRPLKVPASLHTEMPPTPYGTVPSGDGRPGTAPAPVKTQASALLPPLHPDAPEAELAPLRWPWRLLIWIVGFPVGAIVAGLFADALGLVTLNQLEDTVLETGWSRFKPLLRLIPLWALFTALFVTLVIVGIDAARRRRAERAVHRSEVSARSDSVARVDDGGAPLVGSTARADADTEPPGLASDFPSPADPDSDRPTEEIPGTGG